MPAIEIIGVWIAAGLTLMMYSFLYKDNPLFKFGEHLYVGITVGYALCYAWFSIVWPDLVKPLYRVIVATTGKSIEPPLERYETWWLVIPLFFSILMLTRFLPRISWLSRWSFAFIMGTGSGMSIPYVVSASLFKQMEPTLRPFIIKGTTTTTTLVDTTSALLILIGVIAVLLYFFFSLEHKGVIGGVARLGIFYMMVAFGAAFGYTIMARESLAIARVQELIKWSSREYYYATIILLVLVAGLLALFEVIRISSRPPTSPKS